MTYEPVTDPVPTTRDTTERALVLRYLDGESVRLRGIAAEYGERDEGGNRKNPGAYDRTMAQVNAVERMRQGIALGFHTM